MNNVLEAQKKKMIKNKEIALIEYKPAKTVKEMVDYLGESKRVVYKTINKDGAQEILLKCNYINVITPFKHKFAKVDDKKRVIKINNKHVYENDVEFSSYYQEYINERNKYSKIYINISSFESVFKSIVSYMIVNDVDKINNSYELFNYLKNVEERIVLLNGYSDLRKKHMIQNIKDIQANINNYHDIYCLFDRLSLGHLLSLYTGLKEDLKIKIYLEMKNRGMNFGVVDSSQFIDRVFTLVAVRNCIMHNNSLEILVRFYDPKNKYLRNKNDRNKYIKMIDFLSKEK